ncbi:transposase [Pseudomonas jessenii]
MIFSERQSCGWSPSLWERACPRRGRHIQQRYWLTHRYREQARSHSFDLQRTLILRLVTIPVGAGLPAKRPAHPTKILADPPLSRASPLPQF